MCDNLYCCHDMNIWIKRSPWCIQNHLLGKLIDVRNDFQQTTCAMCDTLSCCHDMSFMCVHSLLHCKDPAHLFKMPPLRCTQRDSTLVEFVPRSVPSHNLQAASAKDNATSLDTCCCDPIILGLVVDPFDITPTPLVMHILNPLQKSENDEVNVIWFIHECFKLLFDCFSSMRRTCVIFRLVSL